MSRLQWEGPIIARRIWKAAEDLNGKHIRYEIESYEVDGKKFYTAESKEWSNVHGHATQIAVGDFDTLEEAKEWIEDSVNDIK